jgi:hypothetical protein
MALLDLPVEILDEIIDLTLPSGIEAFALCCKAVYTRAATQIQRHNSLKQRWRCTAFSNNRRAGILRILYAISCDPLAAQYIESLDLYDRGRIPGTTSDDDFPLNEEVKASIKKIISEAECFHCSGVDVDEWCEELWKEYERGPDEESRGEEHALHTTVSLLGQLTNLTKLQLPPGWYDRSRQYEREEEQSMERRLLAVLDAIVKDANSDDRLGKPLGKLEFIMPSMDEGYEERAPFQCLEPFIGLKSLKELYATSCLALDDGYTGIAFQWRIPEMNSSLRRVELTYCTMDDEGISQLLSHTPLLEVFKYHHETKWHGCGYDWNAGAFVEAISKHCGQTITDLAISLQDMYGDIINGVSSFRSFLKLRNLEIDLGIFDGPPLGHGHEWGMAAESLPEGVEPWTVEQLPCLGDMLPDNILDVQINAIFAEKEVKQGPLILETLLKQFPERRELRLKDMARLTIRQYDSDSARSLAKRAGAKLSVFHHINSSHMRRDMMPAWKREFVRRVDELSLLEV